MSENSAGVNDGPIRRAKEWLGKKLPGAQERKDKEITSALETWIGGGLELIKQGNHKQAMDYFVKTKAEEFGFRETVIEAATIPPGTNPDDLTPEYIIGYTNAIASRSKLALGGQRGLPVNRGKKDIKVDFYNAKKLGNTARLQLSYPKYFFNNQEANLPEGVYTEIALVYAEELLHGLQYHKQGPIAGVEDPEKDVATYLITKGVPLTKEFKARYGRELKLPHPNP